MDWLLKPDTVSKSIRAAVLAQVATLLVCYTIWVWEGCDHFMPFISDTDTHPSSGCLLYTSPSPRDRQKSRMPSSA